jgi:hypothetical protein
MYGHAAVALNVQPCSTFYEVLAPFYAEVRAPSCCELFAALVRDEISHGDVHACGGGAM